MESGKVRGWRRCVGERFTAGGRPWRKSGFLCEGVLFGTGSNGADTRDGSRKTSADMGSAPGR